MAPVYESPGAQDSGRAAHDAEREGPKFSGWLAGIFVRPENVSAPSSAGGVPCRNEELRRVTGPELEQSEHMIPSPRYLPGGAYERGSPWGAACGSELVVIERRYDLARGGYIILIRQIGNFSVDVDASPGRVSEAQWQGLRAVFVRPLTSDGYGLGAVIFRKDDSVTQVRTVNLPFDQTRLIAEGIVG